MKYIVYKFPSYKGEPKEFNNYPSAWFYAQKESLKGFVCELKIGNKYIPYWK